MSFNSSNLPEQGICLWKAVDHLQEFVAMDMSTRLECLSEFGLAPTAELWRRAPPFAGYVPGSGLLNGRRSVDPAVSAPGLEGEITRGSSCSLMEWILDLGLAYA